MKLGLLGRFSQGLAGFQNARRCMQAGALAAVSVLAIVVLVRTRVRVVLQQLSKHREMAETIMCGAGSKSHTMDDSANNLAWMLQASPGAACSVNKLMASGLVSWLSSELKCRQRISHWCFCQTTCRTIYS